MSYKKKITSKSYHNLDYFLERTRISLMYAFSQEIPLTMLVYDKNERRQLKKMFKNYKLGK